MKNKKNKKAQNIKALIIILALIVLVLLACIIMICNNQTDKDMRYIYGKKGIANLEVMPTNIDKITYSGDIEINSIYKSMDLFLTKYVEKYYQEVKDLDKDQINLYFNRKKDTIEKELRITDQEIFNEFAQNLKDNLKGENFKLVSYTINPKSVKKVSSKITYVIIANYNDNQTIGFKLSIPNNSKKDKNPITYQACTDEKLLTYEYVPNDYETPEDVEPIGRAY